MTYPKKFFWVYLTTITLFLVGLQHMQSLNSSRTTRTYKLTKKSCNKAKSNLYEHNRLSQHNRVVAPLPLSSNLIKHNDFYYSIFNDTDRLTRYSNVVKTKVRVGKNGDVISVRILNNRRGCKKKRRRRSEIHTISSQRFIPGSVNGKASEFWMNIDFKY